MTPQRDWVPALEAFVQQLMAEHQIPGATLAIAVRGETIYAAGFGHRDVANAIKPTPDTIFGIGSITKSFTALSIMQLAEAGKLSVDDPVVKLLPEFQVPNPEYRERIKIHHFLTHTPGLPPLPILHYAIAAGTEFDALEKELSAKRMAEHGQRPLPHTYTDLMAFMADLPFEMLGEPGRHFSYQNDAYALLGLIVERASGERYQDYVIKHIAEPIGMTRTTFDLAQARAWGDVTEVYARDKQRQVYHSPNWYEAPAQVPAGFLRSTVIDLNRYMTMYANGGVTAAGRRIVSAASVAKMATPHVSRAFGQSYGYGLMVQPAYHGVKLVSHGGGIKGVSAYSGWVEGREIAVSVLTNLALLPSERLWIGGINAALGLPVETPRYVFPDYAMPVEQMQRFVGTYQSGEGATLNVRVEDGGLIVDTGEDRLPARPTGSHSTVVVLRGSESEARFVEDDHGQVKWVFFGGRMIGRVPGATPGAKSPG